MGGEEVEGGGFSGVGTEGVEGKKKEKSEGISISITRAWKVNINHLL